LKQFLFLVLPTICVCCGPSGKRDALATLEKYDSINSYYDRSIDPHLSIQEREKNIDRALYLAKNLQGDSICDKLLYQKSSLLFQAGKYDSLVHYHDIFIENTGRTGNVRLQAFQYYLMGYYYHQVKSDYNRTFENYSAAKNHFALANDSSWVGKCLLYMGVLQKNQNDFFGSKETVTEALQFFKEPKDKKEMVQCYNVLATDHRKLMNYDDAISYYTMAIDNSGSVEDRISFENNLAATYMDYGKYHEAIGILQAIIRDPSLDHTSGLYARIVDNLAYAEWRSGKDVGVGPFMEALDLRARNADKRGQIASYTHLGEFYMKDRPHVAKAYFDTVIDISRQLRIPRAETDALKFLMQLEPENVNIHNRYIFLSDSLYQAGLKVKTQFAKYKYDDKLKQESILRLEKEKTEQSLLAARERNRRIQSYLGSFILIMGMGFAIYFFRQRTKSLEAKNRTARLEATLLTEAEMSRKLHDDFGAGLNQAMLMLQGDVDKEKVLDRLDVLYNQSRNFSREVNDVSTGHLFKQEFLEMLRFRTPSGTNLFITGTKEVDWDHMVPLSQKVLFKVVQELMINMGRHSAADMVTIGFRHTGHRLTVNYSDNGRGASMEELNGKNGLRNTEKRIEAIGGTVIFDSDKGDGFRVHITIPT